MPLFLNKEDLDIAVQSAYKQRNAAQIKAYKDKASKYEDEYNQVSVPNECETCRHGCVAHSPTCAFEAQEHCQHQGCLVSAVGVPKQRRACVHVQASTVHASLPW